MRLESRRDLDVISIQIVVKATGLAKITKCSEYKEKRKKVKDKAQRSRITKGDLKVAAMKLGGKKGVWNLQE